VLTLHQVGTSRSYTGTPAREPDETGSVERDGVHLHWERYGDGAQTVLLMPTWWIYHSRHWKGQIAYLARHLRVVTFDGRGNGLSDRPQEPSAYDASEFADDAAAVLDAAGVESAVVAGVSLGSLYALQLATRHPQRVDAVFFLAPTIPFLVPPDPARSAYSWDDELDTDEGWAKYNKHYWLRDYDGFIDFFIRQLFPEPHSTKEIEDGIAFAHETDAQTLVAGQPSTSGFADAVEVEAALRALRCPVLVAHGTEDTIILPERGVRVAELTGGELVLMPEAGHALQARHPVKINLLLRELAERSARRPPAGGRWTRSLARPKRALLVSSPIGLGHAWRDVAIANELRRQVPGLEIEWLAQHPVTAVLEELGETIHPASAELAGESAHIDSEAGEQDLHVFGAFRRLDEIFCANFMLFHDVVTDTQYDLWIGDEAWEVDRFLHENPELKTASYAWLSDFVGFLPMPAYGEREAFLTADYNAEMIEHLARFPRVRDRSIFIGEPDDIVAARFGDGLPGIRAWTEEHFRFSGYVPAFDPASLPDRGTLRRELGYGDEPLLVVSVGGSGVGSRLLGRVIDATPFVRDRIPALRTLAVAGPRIDPDTLPAADGVEVVTYVHELWRHLAASDFAVVQGGLTTTMELVAAGRPFLSLPLASHFEQTFHVRHRLDRYGARDWLTFADATPERLADAIVAGLGTQPAYLPVDGGGAARAAALIAKLL
jgi:pimeloyl-ACP methyl ester carboxylesterase/predicted glycosyltransferase